MLAHGHIVGGQPYADVALGAHAKSILSGKDLMFISIDTVTSCCNMLLRETEH